MNRPSIILIGGGTMGGAMALRWQAANAATLTIVEPDAARRDHFAKHGIGCVVTLEQAPAGDITILAIKPQQFAAVAPKLAAIRPALLVSIMAGITLSQLQPLCPQAVRVMPNLPSTIGEGMSAACGPALDAPARAIVAELLGHVGAVAWLKDEAQLNAVTAISGSGPAYLFAFMEALVQAAHDSGLSPALARELVTQTVKGAAMLASQSDDDAGYLRAQVTSKGGTTEAALAVFEAGDFQGLVMKAVQAAIARGDALAQAAHRTPEDK